MRGENNLSSPVAKETSSVLFSINNSKATAPESRKDLANGKPASNRLSYNN